jgi:hypothetical protein
LVEITNDIDLFFALTIELELSQLYFLLVSEILEFSEGFKGRQSDVTVVVLLGKAHNGLFELLPHFCFNRWRQWLLSWLSKPEEVQI